MTCMNVSAVQNLKAISKAFNMETIWSVSESSCCKSEGFNFTKKDRLNRNSILDNIKCDCSFKNGTICHVKTM